MSTDTHDAEQQVARCPVRHDFLPLSPRGMDFPEDEIRPMRNETPIFFCEQTHMWVVTRYDDVVAICKDTKRFSSKNQFRARPIPDAAKPLFPEGQAVRRFALLTDDPPRHTRIRKLCNKAFTRPRIAAMRPAIEEHTRMLLDELVPRGEGELISEFSAPLPAAMFADVLGLPRSEVNRILVWGDAFMMTSEMLNVSDEEAVELFKEIKAFNELVPELARERRANPRDESDFMTNLVLAEDSDEPPLTDEELLGVMSIFIVAGHETTRHLIGNAIDLLLQHPDQLAELREDPTRIHDVIEETLRHSGSTKGLFRRAAVDAEIGGVTIPQGDIVQLMFSSANHDEELWEDDMRFDIHREGLNRHIAFGLGRHFCIGAPLARLQGEIAIPELLRRMPNLRYRDGKPPTARIPSLAVYGLERLELEWDAPEVAV
jgi:cytochrome P450